MNRWVTVSTGWKSEAATRLFCTQLLAANEDTGNIFVSVKNPCILPTSASLALLLPNDASHLHFHCMCSRLLQTLRITPFFVLFIFFLIVPSSFPSDTKAITICIWACLRGHTDLTSVHPDHNYHWCGKAHICRTEQPTQKQKETNSTDQRKRMDYWLGLKCPLNQNSGYQTQGRGGGTSLTASSDTRCSVYWPFPLEVVWVRGRHSTLLPALLNLMLHTVHLSNKRLSCPF